MELRDASALVSGAGRGIGRAIALALARAGCDVTGVARTQADLDSLAAETRSAGRTALTVAGDLRDPAVSNHAVEVAVARFGGLQILVNNAGIGVFAPVAETSDADWDAVLATNVTAPFRLTRAALPHLASKGGHVIMISSLAGINPGAGMAAYGASKAALDYLASCLMLEVRHQGVKVTTIAPGSVHTSFSGSPSAKAAAWKLHAEDIATAALDVLRARPEAQLSRIEMRPARPPR